MTSWEEDELLTSWGWTKNLIARRWESPRFGIELGFDDLVAITETPEGEAYLRQVVVQYGEAKQG